MPKLSVKEVRLSELHLPEIKRDEIRRSLSEIRLPEAVSKFEWPEIDLSSVDVGKAMAGAAAAAHLGRRAQRRRWPLAVGGLIVAGVATWAIMSNEALRARLASAAGAIRERISAVRSNWYDGHEINRDDPIAFPAAETAPIGATGYPDGLGSNNIHGIPALEETGNPA